MADIFRLFIWLMDIFSILAVGAFVVGYTAITLEHKINTNKSAVALALGAVLWIIASFAVDSHKISHLLHEASAEVFQIIAFLLAAMALVEILTHYRFFDIIKTRLAQLKLNDKKQFMIMGVLTFFLSAILDNLTVTIVMVQIARQFFTGKNMLIVTAGIVILANAGGAWSPIGDVTTIMLWLADKFTAVQIITQTFVPSAALGLVSGYLLVRQMDNKKNDAIVDTNIRLSTGEKTVIGLTLTSFSFPIIMNLVGLPPFLGLLLGLGMVWGLIEFAKYRSKTPTHLNAHIDSLLQKTDISSLQFFIGILLAVSALNAFGILEKVSSFIFGAEQQALQVAIGSVIIGLLSAIVDNVPLTALSIDLIQISDPYIWTFLALTVGTGGSALIIGSVAGVVAMGMVKELTFGKYLKIATIPALLGYLVAVAIYTLIFYFFDRESFTSLLLSLV